MNKSEKAKALMLEHRFNCSQSVLSAFCEEFGLDRNLALKVAMGFGGGMGRTGNTCGAVTGAYMVLGLSQKMDAEHPRESTDRTYQLVQEFNKKFKALNGSLLCKELIGYDLSSPEQLAEARSKGVIAVICPKLVSDSVTIMEKMFSTY
ncbi:MAG: C-GCAxxG-C-C family protein [Dehalococcoidales bacterium]|nr:C-GCAxxG-C-C family protein [Dehalococcoidales bacterium]